MPDYTLIDHTADLGIELHADNLPGLFSNAAYAMFDLICDTGNSTIEESNTITLSGRSPADLLFSFLRELLYMWAVEMRIVKTADILEITEDKLSARLDCILFDSHCHEIKNEIKAVTWHMFEVAKTHKGWFARVIFDV